MRLKKPLRKAIAMIELIFAIVILGITMMSAPLLISQSTSSSLVTFQQESIAIAASHTSALLTYAWDESNTINIPSQNIMLYVPPSVSTDIELNATTPTLRANPLVPTIFPAARRRQFNPLQNLFATLKIGIDANDTDDDIDDFVENNLTLSTSSAATNNVDAGEYMDTAITLVNTVTYADDNTNYALATIAAPNFQPIAIVASDTLAITNIKVLNVQLTSTSLSAELRDKNINMRAFMCNIGGATPRTVGAF